MEQPTELHEIYDIAETAVYIIKRGFTRVALQFPDEMLKVSVAVTSALKNELERQFAAVETPHEQRNSVKFYVMADTTYGSCCADEIAAAHVNAECIIHYGHTCLSKPSRLPVRYVFGRAAIDLEECAKELVNYASKIQHDLVVLYDLEYAYAIPRLQEKTQEKKLLLVTGDVDVDIMFADLLCKEMDPSERILQDNGTSSIASEGLESIPSKECRSSNDVLAQRQTTAEESAVCCSGQQGGKEVQQFIAQRKNKTYSLGGLRWSLPENDKMEDLLMVWIGQECPALTNIMLTYNNAAIMCYDPEMRALITNVANQSKVLKRRYYLVERAKDANIVGIVVGTLGVAGYRQMVHQIKRLVKAAGKKSYTLVIGKPNPSKLANFPECDVFVLVACAQTALLDSKDFLAPLITPFEAVLAFTRGRQWMGDYQLDFGSVLDSSDGAELGQHENDSTWQAGDTEGRFSFLKGGYVEESIACEPERIFSRAVVLSQAAERALKLRSDLAVSLEAKSGVEYLASRSYQGLEMQRQSETPNYDLVLGKKGRASAYEHEPGKQVN